MIMRKKKYKWLISYIKDQKQKSTILISKKKKLSHVVYEVRERFLEEGLFIIGCELIGRC